MAVARRLSLILALALTGCSGAEEEQEPAEQATPQASCREVSAPEPRAEGALQPPAGPLPAGVEHRLRVETSCGAFTITLDPEASPQAAASVASLP